ncbi:MAG: hypothetical protein CM1200mP26_00540 [Acidimicrobiales bacterium]|nr:MAG: hypothetical protein CM1200mP26_00540 [Acidimicrobiales bacterium]
MEALAYRGWLRWRSADRAAALIDLDDAVAMTILRRRTGISGIGPPCRRDHAGAAVDLVVWTG